MYGVARSQRLLGYRFTAEGNSPAFRCPEGYVTLVKTMAAYNWWTAQRDVYLFVSTGDGFVQLQTTLVSLVGSTGQEWQGWLVLHPGDTVAAHCTGSDVHVWVSGAVLLGGPQFPSAELADPLVWPPTSQQLPGVADLTIFTSP